MSHDGVNPGRLQSIDLLRGLDVLLMLFVNDLAMVPGAPWYLLHREPQATVDGMTITDVVFPAFLFLVGMAVPLAVASRLDRGATRGELWRHVLGRTAALLALGVLMANAPLASPTGLLSPPWWTVLMTLGAILAWQAPGEGARRFLRPIGFALVLLAVLTFRSDAAVGFIQIRPLWWGILGLIGWAYLVASAAYLWVGDRPVVLAAVGAGLYGLYVADQVGGFFRLTEPWLDLGVTVAGHAAIAVAGVVLGVLLRLRVMLRLGGGDPRILVRDALLYAAGLAVAGWLLHLLAGVHGAFVVNKMNATPPWGLYSSALTVVAWVALFVLVDVKRWRGFPRLVVVAGENALPAYLLPGLLLAVFAVVAGVVGHDPYQRLATPLGLGMARSFAFAVLVVALCAAMRRVGLRLQL